MRILILHISRAMDAEIRQFILFRERSDKKNRGHEVILPWKLWNQVQELLVAILFMTAECKNA